MRRLPISTLLLVALVSAVAGYVVIDRFFGRLPPVAWSSASLYLVAVVDLVLAVRIRRAVSENRVGQDRRQVHPLTVVRALALGQASAVLGALAAGAGAGLTLFLVLHRQALAAARDDLPGGVAVLVGGSLLAVAGIVLERSCAAPPGQDESTVLAEAT